jgi:protein-S-isoprenylcysteine O-methyltransferase Ste14
MVEAALINVGLLALFGAQHSVMAREGFKRHWRRVAPAAVERAVYITVTTAVLLVAYWQWRPMPAVIWKVENGAGRALVWAVAAGGAGLVLWAQAVLDPFGFFGVRQIRQGLKGEPYAPPRFQTPGPYRFVRHPSMLGLLVMFWAAAEMTAGRLLLASAMTGYIVLALRWEERDLLREHGEAYHVYQREVPMLVPRMNAKRWNRR